MSRGVTLFILVQVPCFLESAKKREEGQISKYFTGRGVEVTTLFSKVLSLIS